MRILMMTNNYKPYTGGVEKSVELFTGRFRRKGHSVLVVAPQADGDYKDDDADVVRVSAIKNFNDSNLPVTIPLPGELMSRLEEFGPEIVHSHFPFIIGSTAMRTAVRFEIPLVFTYHTMYEHYIHYVNTDSDRIRAFVKTLTAGYSNLCDLVIAPSQAVKDILCRRGVITPIEVIPTGVDTEPFMHGDGDACRKQHQIQPDSFVVGHVGRLAPEKNLMFLTDAVSRFLKEHPEARFLVVGEGLERQVMEQYIVEHNLSQQVVFAGILKGQALVDAYHAMDIFVFSSKTETQGMVLTEAMAAGVPVAALNAPGVTDVLQHEKNGYRIDMEDPQLLAQAIGDFFNCSATQRQAMKQNALQTATDFSIDVCADRVLKLYQQLAQDKSLLHKKEEPVWKKATDRIKAEWDIFSNYVNAAGNMIHSSKSGPE